MTTTNVARYGFTPPDPRVLDPSTLEQIFAQQLTTRDSPFAGAMLGLEQMDRKQQAREYLSRLGEMNSMQRELALRQMAADQNIETEKRAVDLFQYGADLSNIVPLRRYLANNAVTESGDIIRRQGALARALEASGKGLNEASQAGVQTNPGQVTDMSPGSLARLLATTRERGDVIREDMEGKPKTTVTFPSVSGPGGAAQIASTGRDPVGTVQQAHEARVAHGQTNIPGATNIQQSAVANTAAEATRQGAKVVRQIPQGNNIIVEFDKPVSAKNGRTYRQVVINANGQLISGQ